MPVIGLSPGRTPPSRLSPVPSLLYAFCPGKEKGIEDWALLSFFRYSPEGFPLSKEVSPLTGSLKRFDLSFSQER